MIFCLKLMKKKVLEVLAKSPDIHASFSPKTRKGSTNLSPSASARIVIYDHDVFFMLIVKRTSQTPSTESASYSSPPVGCIPVDLSSTSTRPAGYPTFAPVVPSPPPVKTPNSLCFIFFYCGCEFFWFAGVLSHPFAKSAQ